MNRTTRALLAAVGAALALTACSVTVDSRPSDPSPAADTADSNLTDDERATLLAMALDAATADDRAALCYLWERDGGAVVAASLNEELDADQRLSASIVDDVFGEEC